MMREPATTSGFTWTAITKSLGVQSAGMVAVVVGALALLLTPGSILANKKAPVLPTAVLDAKTIYIDNQANDATLLNDAFLERLEGRRCFAIHGQRIRQGGGQRYSSKHEHEASHGASGQCR
jgi:hypothetical protein